MSQIHKERLLQLATFLREKVPDQHWDLSVITKDGRDDAEIALPQIAAGERRDCGAAACAIGWMPGAFPNEFRWSPYGVEMKDDGKNPKEDFEAAQAFFGINASESNFLFMPGSYCDDGLTTRHEVAQRIEEFVKEPTP